MATASGCALCTGKGQPSFPSTSAVLKSEGPSERELRRRTSTSESIGLRPYGSRWLLPKKTSSVQLSHNFVPKKAVVVPQASNSRIAASKQVASKGKNNRKPDKSLGEVRIKGENEQQSKTRTSPSSVPDNTATTRQVVVKDGFAGLSAFKAQLEKEKPRISRVKLNDVQGQFLPRQKKQAELRKSKKAADTSPTSSNSDVVTMGTSSSQSTSSNGPIHEGETVALICVTNLAKEVTEEEYESVMQSVPEVTSWKYLTDTRGQCLGYGFCEVQAESDLEAIVEHLSEQSLHGKRMKASLSEPPGKYKQSLERQIKRDVSSKAQGKGSPGVRKQVGLRDVWKAQGSSMEIETTEMRRSEDYSQGSSISSIPRDRKLDRKFKNSKPDMEEVQNFTSRSMERDATEMGSSSTSVGSSQGLDSQSSMKLSGKSVLEALQRAAALRDSTQKPRRRKGRSGSSKYGSDSDSEDDSKQDLLPPLVFKSEWVSRIQELENDLKQLRRLP